jgi:hypothetical protein
MSCKTDIRNETTAVTILEHPKAPIHLPEKADMVVNFDGANTFVCSRTDNPPQPPTQSPDPKP